MTKIEEMNKALIAEDALDGEPCTIHVPARDDGGIAVLGMPRIFVPLKVGGACRLDLYCDRESLKRLATACVEALGNDELDVFEITLQADPFTVDTGRHAVTYDDGRAFEAGSGPRLRSSSVSSSPAGCV